MSWLDYKNLLEGKNADPAAWQAARKANPNEQESALFHALDSVLTEGKDTALYDIAALMLKLAKAVEQALALALDDPYMPTDEEWAAHPWATEAATDDGGGLFLYDTEPVLGKAVWLAVGDRMSRAIRTTTPPADFRNTLRRRPDGV